MFSMFSMLAMQLFCTFPHASRTYSQKLRCPSELNQLPDPGPRVRRQSNTTLLCSARSHGNSGVATGDVPLPGGYLQPYP